MDTTPSKPRRADRPSGQREMISRIVIEIVAESGLDAVTIRRVAARAGYSTSIVTHHFSGKRELLLSAYRWIANLSFQEVYKAIGKDNTDLLALLRAAAQLNRLDYWRVYIAFWAEALANDELRAEHVWRTDGLTHTIEELLLERQYKGLTVNGTNAQAIAQDVVLQVQGLGLQATFYPTLWTEQRRDQFLERIAASVVGVENVRSGSARQSR